MDLLGFLVEHHVARRLAHAAVAVELGPGDRPVLPGLAAGTGARTIAVDVVLDEPALQGFDECRTGRAEDLPLADRSVDLIVTKWVFEHVQDPSRAVAEFARVLKQGGAIAFITPNRRHPAFMASALLQRLVPFRLLQRPISRIAGRPPREVYHAFYRLSTPETMARLWAPYGRTYVDAVDGLTAVYGLQLRRLTRGRLSRLRPFLVGRLERTA